MTDKELEELLAGAGEDEDSLVAELEHLREDAQPGPSFTARVMSDVDTRKRGLLARFRDAVVRPRILRFNVAMAVPVGVAATLLGMLLLSGDDAPRAPAGGEVAAAPQPGDDAVVVRFSLAAPGARRVAVAGDFNEWSVDAAPLDDSDGDGIWTVSLPVERGRYAYMFVVDGERWLLDPAADAVQPDGFGGQNAVLRL